MRTRLLTLAICLLAAEAGAQVVIPAGLEPGQIQRGLKEMRAPGHSALQVTPAAPVQVAPPDTAALKFVLREVLVEGATVYPPEAARSDIRKLHWQGDLGGAGLCLCQ